MSGGEKLGAVVTETDTALRKAVLRFIVDCMDKPCSDGDMADDRRDKLDVFLAEYRVANPDPLLVQALEALREVDRMNDHPGWFREELDQVVMPILAQAEERGL